MTKKLKAKIVAEKDTSKYVKTNRGKFAMAE